MAPTNDGAASESGVVPLAIDGPVYACGDLHGRDDLMLEFLAWVDADAGHGPATVVFLGDFVDRGFGGRRVVERLICGPSRKDHRWVPLKGNHDALFASAWRNPGGRDAVAWVANGGVATLASYGVAPGEAFRVRVPEAHVEFLEKLPLAADDGERLYVHAGVRPGVPMALQSPFDLTWIRDEFLASDHGFDRIVVHGHTISRHGLDVRPWRVGLDMGAYATGRLCCARFLPGVAEPLFHVAETRSAPVWDRAPAAVAWTR